MLSLLLLEKGAKVNQAGSFGQTPLNVAKNNEIKKLLRAKGGKKGRRK